MVCFWDVAISARSLIISSSLCFSFSFKAAMVFSCSATVSSRSVSRSSWQWRRRIFQALVYQNMLYISWWNYTTITPLLHWPCVPLWSTQDLQALQATLIFHGQPCTVRTICQTKLYGERFFSYIAPTVWNTPPKETNNNNNNNILY